MSWPVNPTNGQQTTIAGIVYEYNSATQTWDRIFSTVNPVDITSVPTVTNADQPNITSVGTLSNLNVSGNVTAAFFVGDGSQLTGISGSGGGTNYSNANVSAYLPTYTGNLSVNNISGNGAGLTHIAGGNITGTVASATTAATVTTAAQPNITSVGSLNNLSVVGTATAGNFAGNGSRLTHINSANIDGQVANATVAGTVYSNAQPNITSVGTLSSLNVTGNVTSGNAKLGNLATANYFSGDGSLLTHIQSTHIDGQVANANIADQVYNNNQPNITSVGTLAGLNVNGNVSITGEVSITGNVIPTENIVYDLGNATHRFRDLWLSGNTLQLGEQTITTTATGVSVSGTLSGDGSQITNLDASALAFGTIPDAILGNSTVYIGTTPIALNRPSIEQKLNGTSIDGYANAVSANDQPNITSVGTLANLAVNNDVFIATGNLTINSAKISYDAANNSLKSSVKINADGSLLTNLNSSSITGTVGTANTVTSNAQPNITSVGTLSSLNVSGNITSSYVIANGSQLTHINGSNITGQVANALVASTVYSNAQPNITSVGTLSTLNVSGNVSASYVLGNGSQLSGISAVSAGTVTTNAQPNITSVGTLSSLNVSGNVNAAYFIGNGSQLTGLPTQYANSNVASYLPTYTGNVNAAYFIGNGSQLTGLPTQYANSNVASYLPTYTGNVNAAYFIGNGSQLTHIQNTHIDGQVANANIADQVYNNNQPNITSVGTLANLSVTGTVHLGTVTNVHVDGGSSGYVLQTDGTGNLSWVSPSSTGIAGSDGQIQFNTNGSFDASSNFKVDKANAVLTVTGNVSATNFIGNGSLLTNISNTNIVGQIANSLVAGTVYSNAQPNITSVGTLSSVNVSGDAVIGGNLTVNGTMTAINSTVVQIDDLAVVLANDASSSTQANGAGIIINGAAASILYNSTSNSFVLTHPITANGSQLTNINGSNISGNVANATHAFVADSANSVQGANVTGQVANALTAGTITANAQPNITSVGTLSSLNVSGNTTAQYFIGNGSQLTHIANTNIDGQVANALVASTVYTNAQPNITSVGTLSTLHVSGNVTAQYFVGNGSTLTSLTGGNVVGNVANAVHAFSADTATLVPGSNVSGQVSNAAIAGTVYSNAQPNITSLGTLSGLNVAGGVSADYYLGPVANGQSNISIPSIDGNVQIVVGGQTKLVASASGINVTGEIKTSGNVTAQYFVGDVIGNISGTLSVPGNNTAVIFNNNDAAGASDNLTFNTNTNTLKIIGTVDASNLKGDGSQLTSINGANVSEVANANYATHSGVASTVSTNAQPNITSVGTLSSLNVTGNVSAQYFVGNGSQLTHIANTNIDGQVANALVASTVYTNAQPNITSVGTLTSLNVSGNVTGSYVIGNGSALSSITGSNVTGQVANALIATTITANAQPNITSVGTLASLNVSGNTTAQYFVGNGSQLTHIAGSNVDGQVANALIATTITANAQPNITSVGTLSSLTVTGNTTAQYFVGNGSQLTHIANTNIDGQVANSLVAGTVYTNAQPNITSVGTLTGLGVTGNVNITGNINVTGNLNYSNVTNMTVGDALIYIGEENTSNLLDLGIVAAYSNDGVNDIHTGVVRNHSDNAWTIFDNVSAEPTTTVDFANASYGNFKAGNVFFVNSTLGNVATANFFVGDGSLLTGITVPFTHAVTDNYQPNITRVGTLANLNISGNVTSAYFIGNGSQLTHIANTNIDGQVANALVASTVYTNAQPNITSVGTLSSLNVSGNTTAEYFIGNGSQLTHIANTNIDGQVANANIADQVYNNNQPNITSVGTLSSLNVSGNVTTAQYFIGNGSQITHISNTNIDGQVANALIASTVYTNAQPNITSVGTLSSLNVSGNITANYYIGNGSALVSLTGANVVGDVPTAAHVSNAAQPNITSLGTLTNLTVTNTVNTGNITATTKIVSPNIAGTLFTGNQPNITAVGTLDNLTVSDTGLIQAGDITSTGTITAPIFVGDVFGNVSGKLLLPGVEQGIAFRKTGNATTSSNLKFDYTTSNLTVIGNIISNSIYSTNVSVSNTITIANAEITNANMHFANALFISGNGSSISNLNASNIASGTIPSSILGNSTVYIGQTGVALNRSSAVLTLSGVNTDGYAATVTSNAQPNITSVGTLASLNVTGNVTGAYFIGDGSQLTHIQNTHIDGQVANSLIAGTVYTADQPNITSTGTLSSLAVAGDTTIGGNLTVNGTMTAINSTIVQIDDLAIVLANDATTTTQANGAGIIINGANANILYISTSNAFVSSHRISADGGLLSNVTGANVTGFVPNANVANTAYSVSGSNVTGQVANALIAGTVFSNAQPNITSVGTLASLSITGNVTSGNIAGGNLVSANYVSGNGSLLTAITGANVTGFVPNANIANTAYSVSGSNVTGQVSNALVAGTVYTAAQPNITSVGTLASVSVTGNVSSSGNIIGNGQYLTSINGANVTGYVANATHANIADIANVAYSITGGNVTGQVANALIAGTVYTNAQPNITSIGTLASLSVTGLTTATGGIKTANIQDASGTVTVQTKYNNQSGDIGVVGNIVAGTGGTGNVSAQYFVGNGAFLTGIVATGSSYSNTNVSAYLSTYSGNLSANVLTANSFSAGTGAGGTLSGANLISANYVSAQYFIGDGSQLTGVAGSGFTSSTVATSFKDAVTNTAITLTNANISNTTTKFTDTLSMILSGTAQNIPLTGHSLPATFEYWYYPTSAATNSAFFTSVGSLSGSVVQKFYLYQNGTYWSGGVGDPGGQQGTVAMSLSQNQWNHIVVYLAAGSFTTWINGTRIHNAVALSANTGGINYQQTTARTGVDIGPLDGYYGSYLITSGDKYGVANSTITLPTSSFTTGGNATNLIAANKITTITTANNVAANNVTATGNVSATYFIGNGSQLTGLPATYTNANVATYMPTYLPTYTGNISAGNISATGNVSATYFIGNGSQLTGLPATYANTNVAAYLPTYTGNVGAGNVVGTSANVTITAGAFVTSFKNDGNISLTANSIVGLSGSLSQISGANLLSASYITGTLTTGAQPNVTSLGTLQNTTMSSAASLTGANLVSATFLTGTLTTLAQPNITSVGSLASLTVTGLTTATGGVKTANIQDATGTVTIQTKYNALAGDIGVVGNIIAGTGGAGNVSATYFIGNGSQLTGLPATYANTNVATYLPTYTGNLSPGNITFKKYNETVIAGGNTSTSISPDVSTGSIFTYTANASFTFNGLTNAVAGTSCTIIITQDGTGNRAMTPGASIKWASGLKVLSTGSSAIDIITMFYDGTTYYATLTKGFS